MNYILCSSVTLYDIYSIISQEYGKLFVTVVLYLYILFKSNQIKFYFVTTTTLHLYANNKNKYCYVVVTWHVMCRLHVTPNINVET